jgi:hypothetical protein
LMYDIPTIMRASGWVDEPMKGPTSTWFNVVDKDPKWVEEGATDHKMIYARVEERERWRELIRVAGVIYNWPYYRRWNQREENM